MARDLAPLIRRKFLPAAARSRSLAAPASSGILDSHVARHLGKAPPRRTPWISERDFLDAAMTFALTFTGAIIFLL
jgi:hypothetical protein